MRANNLRALRAGLAATVALSATACLGPTSVGDLNNISSGTIANGLNRASVQLLTTGMLNADRAANNLNVYVLAGAMQRDVYRLDPAEGRFITETVGTAADPGGFVGGSVWGGMFTTVRAANTVIDGVAGANDLSNAEKAATTGLARTIKALAYYHVIETRDSIGIPVALDQPIGSTPAPFVCKPNALAYVSALLDSAYADLQAGGSAFPFSLPAGFSVNGTFGTPARFGAINRGLKGKVELYRGLDHAKPSPASFAAAISALTTAIGTSGVSNLNDGVYYVYSTASGEIQNPLFDAAVHLNPAVGDSILAGDARRSKIIFNAGTFSGSGVRTTYNAAITVTSNAANATRSLPVLRMAELYLLRAQARIESGDLAGAVQDINFIRVNEGGLPPIATPANKEDARSAVLYEKRYSLLLEGGAHRLVDLRAYGRMSERYLKKEISTDFFQSTLPIPKGEIDGRGGQQPTLVCN